jgi:site-specific DNA-cytosine methylase
MAYAFGAVAFPSAGIGAPHIRDRTYWVAHAAGRATIGRGTSPELTIQPGAT